MDITVFSKIGHYYCKWLCVYNNLGVSPRVYMLELWNGNKIMLSFYQNGNWFPNPICHLLNTALLKQTGNRRSRKEFRGQFKRKPGPKNIRALIPHTLHPASCTLHPALLCICFKWYSTKTQTIKNSNKRKKLGTWCRNAFGFETSIQSMKHSFICYDSFVSIQNKRKKKNHESYLQSTLKDIFLKICRSCNFLVYRDL